MMSLHTLKIARVAFMTLLYDSSGMKSSVHTAPTFALINPEKVGSQIA